MHRGVCFPSESAEDIELIFLLLLECHVLCDDTDKRLRLAILAGGKIHRGWESGTVGIVMALMRPAASCVNASALFS